MTFAALNADFNDRVDEVDLFFTMVAALENDELKVVAGVGAQVVPPGAPPPDWSRTVKGTAYLVLYNLVEAFIRRGFQEVFDAIKVDKLTGADLTAELRKQWIGQKNRKVKAFDGSPKVYMEIAEEIVTEIIEKRAAEMHRSRLPFSGNLDADIIRLVCRRHGVSHATTPGAAGGDSLKIVKTKRNALAHGDESFAECGRLAASAELMKIKNEVVVFTRDILANLEQFATSKSYASVP